MTAGSLTVTRRIRLKTSPSTAAELLTGIPGIETVRPVGDRRLEVTYNLSHLRLDDVERRLVDGGATLADTLWHSLRKNWLRFTETNLVDQAHIVHHCCNTPPTGKNP